jgi:hypothetical protein
VVAVLELDPEGLDEDPEELEPELEELEEEPADELEFEDVGGLIFGAPGSGLVPHPNRETQRHNTAKYFTLHSDANAKLAGGCRVDSTAKPAKRIEGKIPCVSLRT